MVAIVKRMRKLTALLAIRLGPGAVILPPEVTKIHMEFAYKIRDGHIGGRHFWRNCLPRLKYHNPSVAMSVHRSNDQEGPSIMTVHFAPSSAAADSKTSTSPTTSAQTPPAPPTASKLSTSSSSSGKVQVINMKMRRESEILNELIKLTDAKVVRATPQESRQLQELQEQNMRSARDQVMMKQVNEKRKREEAILTQARGEVEAAKQH